MDFLLYSICYTPICELLQANCVVKCVCILINEINDWIKYYLMRTTGPSSAKLAGPFNGSSHVASLVTFLLRPVWKAISLQQLSDCSATWVYMAGGFGTYPWANRIYHLDSDMPNMIHIVSRPHWQISKLFISYKTLHIRSELHKRGKGTRSSSSLF